MSQDDPVHLAATDLVDGYLGGELDPVEVVEAHLERIAAIDPRVNSYITVTAERARERALASRGRYRSGRPSSAVDGVQLFFSEY